jgi:hypothetical protein
VGSSRGRRRRALGRPDAKAGRQRQSPPSVDSVREEEESAADWFYLYILGLLIVVAAVALGLNLIGFPPLWILITTLLLLAIALLTTMLLRARERGGKP